MPASISRPPPQTSGPTDIGLPKELLAVQDQRCDMLPYERLLHVVGGGQPFTDQDLTEPAEKPCDAHAMLPSMLAYLAFVAAAATADLTGAILMTTVHRKGLAPLRYFVAGGAGFMLAACFAAFRNLWVPIGLHFAWNFLLAGIFSLTSSGNYLGKGLLDVTVTGPELFTGGEFGPEGGVAAVGTGALLTLIFLVVAHRRGHVVRPGGRSAGVTTDPTFAR